MNEDIEKMSNTVIINYSVAEQMDLIYAIYNKLSDKEKRRFILNKDNDCIYKVGDVLYYEHDFPRKYIITDISDNCEFIYVANFNSNKCFKLKINDVDTTSSNFYSTYSKLLIAKCAYHRHMLNFYGGCIK